MIAFSVITPTLNAERYLAECLASVMLSAPAGLEHIVVDGGSSDATERIARAAPGVTFISSPGLNQSEALNAGMKVARGEVVAWLNADDTYVEGAVALALSRFAADLSLDVLMGDCEVIGPQGEHLWWERPGPYDFGRLLKRGNYIAQPAVFMRLQALQRVGYLDESLENGMDYDLWLKFRDCKIEYIERPLACFRWHSESKSATLQIQGWRETLRIVRRYGGGWTPHLAWAYARCLITLARTGAVSSLTGSRPLRPLTRGRHLFEHGQVAPRHFTR